MSQKAQQSLLMERMDVVNGYLLVGPTSRLIITGLSMAFDLVVKGFADRKLPYLVADVGAWGIAKEPGTFDWQRMFTTIAVLFAFWCKLWRAQTVYMIIASSLWGFIRNALMIWPSCWLGRRLVLHLHGGGYEYFYQSQSSWLQGMISRTLSQADTIIVLGENLREQFAFLPDVNIAVVPNSIPVEPPAEAILPKSLPTDSPLRLLYLSNLIESKGYLDLLAACRVLHHEYEIPIQCAFCGKFIRTTVDHHQSAEEAMAHFTNLIDTWELKEVVTYHGLVSGAIKDRLLQQAHALVLPTTYPWEGQPISILEALAYGTPVIATAHRDIPSQVINRYNGFLVSAHAPLEIADAVRTMWQSPALYTRLSQSARQHFRENYTQEHHLNRLIPIICGHEH